MLLISNFPFYFCYCSIDATDEPSRGPLLGRLVNHGEKKEINAKTRILQTNRKPAMCLFALKVINVGEEILYDYGVKDLPWKETKVNYFTTSIIILLSCWCSSSRVR